MTEARIQTDSLGLQIQYLISLLKRADLKNQGKLAPRDISDTGCVTSVKALNLLFLDTTTKVIQ